MRQIAHGDAEGEVQRREHDSEEDPPASHGRDEGEGATGLGKTQSSADSTGHGVYVWRWKGETYHDEFPSSLGRHCVCRVFVRKGQVPVRTGQAAKGTDEGEENHEEDDVGAEGADEEDEADESCVRSR